PGRTIGASNANAAFCHAAPRQDACHRESVASRIPSTARTSHNAGGPVEFETVTEISFSPSLRSFSIPTVWRFFQSRPSKVRFGTVCPLIVTLPDLKQRSETLALEGARFTLKELLKTVAI